MGKFFPVNDDSVLIIIDIQERLVNAMQVKDLVISNCLHLIELAKMFAMPVLVTEQYPKGLGRTIEEIKAQLREENIAFLDVKEISDRHILVSGYMR